MNNEIIYEERKKERKNTSEMDYKRKKRKKWNKK